MDAKVRETLAPRLRLRRPSHLDRAVRGIDLGFARAPENEGDAAGFDALDARQGVIAENDFSLNTLTAGAALREVGSTLESVYGVPLIAISQHTQDNPAGRMARRMLASMASFFTEQLAVDVKEGLARRVRDGWFPTVPPYGYSTERVNSRSVVRVDPGEAENVKRIFHLYAYDNRTLDGVSKQLDVEARAYTVKQPHWVRSKIHRILRDRAYIGDVKYHGGYLAGSS